MMAMMEADKVRPIPDIQLDDRDEECIKMIMVGTFLTGYRSTRLALDGLEDVAEKLDALFRIGEQNEVIKFISKGAAWYTFDKVRGRG